MTSRAPHGSARSGNALAHAAVDAGARGSLPQSGAWQYADGPIPHDESHPLHADGRAEGCRPARIIALERIVLGTRDRRDRAALRLLLRSRHVLPPEEAPDLKVSIEARARHRGRCGARLGGDLQRRRRHRRGQQRPSARAPWLEALGGRAACHRRRSSSPTRHSGVQRGEHRLEGGDGVDGDRIEDELDVSDASIREGPQGGRKRLRIGARNRVRQRLALPRLTADGIGEGDEQGERPLDLGRVRPTPGRPRRCGRAAADTPRPSCRTR